MKTYLKDLTPEEIIKRLKNGEVVKEDREKVYGNHVAITCTYKMVDGVLYAENDVGNIEINPSLQISDRYFETEEPFEIKETGLYRTRDGIKVFVSKIVSDVVFGIIEGFSTSYDWNKNGRYLGEQKSSLDIISKWEEMLPNITSKI